MNGLISKLSLDLENKQIHGLGYFVIQVTIAKKWRYFRLSRTVCACGGVAWGKLWCRDLVGKGQGWTKPPMMHDTATTAKNYWIQILAVSKLRNPDLINIKDIFTWMFSSTTFNIIVFCYIYYNSYILNYLSLF